MSFLLVTPLSALETAIRDHSPSHLVTLLSPEHMIQTPPGFPGERHLRLGVNDIIDTGAGDFPPAREHVERLLEFSRAWSCEMPMLVHCWAGVSRSMAAAFIILCDRTAQGREMSVARALRSRAPHAWPNLLLIKHADELMRRHGKMVEAIETIGAGEMVAEGRIVTLPVSDL